MPVSYIRRYFVICRFNSSIGNHESKGTDYKYHYNNPNTEDNLGATNSGSDYYFSYGDVLYIVLNSNNRNAGRAQQTDGKGN